jgi:signal peptidase II
MAIAIGMVLGGALGNLSDRAFRGGGGFLGGGVVDFVDLQWWPVFNVADSAIVVGAILLFLVQWRDEVADDGRGPATRGEPTGGASTGGAAEQSKNGRG